MHGPKLMDQQRTREGLEGLLTMGQGPAGSRGGEGPAQGTELTGPRELGRGQHERAGQRLRALARCSTISETKQGRSTAGPQRRMRRLDTGDLARRRRGLTDGGERSVRSVRQRE